MTIIPNDNTPTPTPFGTLRGIIQCVHGGDDAFLYGSVSGAAGEWVLIEQFTGNELKEVALPSYLLVSGAANQTTTLAAGTKVLLDPRLGRGKA